MSSSILFAQEDFGKNRFEYNVGYNSLAHKDGSSWAGFYSAVTYERIMGDPGKLGMKFIGDLDLIDENEMVITFGAGLNWYPLGNAKWLYLGPVLKFGSLISTYGSSNETNAYIGLGLNVGCQFKITKLFGIRAGIGYDVVKVGESDFADFGAFQSGVGFNFSF